MRELSRAPRRVLERVFRGERLIVCRHGHPVATLQPLNGCVTQPLGGPEHDVVGSPLGDISQEIAKLRPLEKKILMECVKWDRIHYSTLAGPDMNKTLREWEVRGLARKTRRGRILSGRGMILREALLERAGLTDRLYE